jgi:hypothetical protein
MTSQTCALEYLNAGLCVLPAKLKEKRPDVAWKKYQTTRPTEPEIRKWFSRSKPICMMAGAISGNLEMLDFDQKGEFFDRWLQLVASESPGLVERLVIERSQSGGKHVPYRCEIAVPGNQKLAERTIVVATKDDVIIGGKSFTPRRVDDHFEIRVTFIETRGEGGIFLCAPTPGYVLEQGSLTSLPVLTEAERSLLIQAAQALNESVTPFIGRNDGSAMSGRPGDDFDARGDLLGLLQKHQWTVVYSSGDRLYLRRPGKEDSGWSATLSSQGLYVFSSNASPFEADRGYSPFAVYALLEHRGDFSLAAAALRKEGFGDDGVNGVDLSGILSSVPAASTLDPGPLPSEMFRVPGFISEVMDHTLATAPYPNVPLAFCGALALQAMLAGRKVRDAADNRSNIYVLALAHSSAGKDWPRKVNTNVLHRIGLVDSLGEKFASGEGIQDALYTTPSMLFQTDEIDGLLQSINKSQDARHENLLSTLLTMYSASNSIFPMRRKAGKELPGVIDQPNLVVFGTAIPVHYYAALSERMLTNGFFARMLIVESGPRGSGQEPSMIDPPERVIETARWWATLSPGSDNLIGTVNPEPRIVPYTQEARDILQEARRTSESEYTKSEGCDDVVGTTVWGRVPEQIRKLALLHAVSANHEVPQIDVLAARWATDFIMHQTRRMLFMAKSHVADNPFHASCLKLVQKLRAAPGRKLAHSVALKRMKIGASEFKDLVATLEQQGDIRTLVTERSGSSIREYQLLEE